MSETTIDTATERDSGRFVWHDLVTQDVDASRRFYEQLFGWRVESTETDEGQLVLSTPEGPIAGMVELDEGQELLSRWVAYVAVDEITEPPARALKMEGKAPVRDERAWRSGSFSVVTDPLGASLAVVNNDRDASAAGSDRPTPSTFCWHEIVTSDPEQAKEFYCDVLDWRVAPMPQGDHGPYWMFLNDNLGVAGVRPAPPLPGQRAFWLSYVAVDDVDDTALRAEQLGGSLLTAPLEVPGFGRFATLADTQGGFFAILNNQRI